MEPAEPFVQEGEPSAPLPKETQEESESVTVYPWLLRTYDRKKKTERSRAEIAHDLDRCTRRAIVSYAKRIEQYHPQMAEQARLYAKNPMATPSTMAAVIDRLQWALREEGERVRNFFYPGQKTL